MDAIIQLDHASLQVFTPQVMESFVVRTILPKLAYCLQVELQINPHQQKIGAHMCA